MTIKIRETKERDREEQQERITDKGDICVCSHVCVKERHTEDRETVKEEDRN